MKNRESNIELLRIIAIMMVLMLHFNLVGWHPDVLSCSEAFSWTSLEGKLIEAFCIAAVNVFVMISGYFAIKLSLKSVLNLYIRCFIIGIVSYLAYILIVGEPISISAIGGRVLAFTDNHWWFVISYIGLMAISPILNAGCEALSKRLYVYVLALLSVVMLYFGWYKNLEVTNGGYSLIHFVYLYIIARYIKLHVREQIIKEYRFVWLTLFFLMVVLVVAMAYIEPMRAYAYNSPIIIIEAISLLLFFVSIPFYNKFINWIALSVFSAYLIQSSPYFGQMWLYPKVNELFMNGCCISDSILFATLVISTLIISIAIDKVLVMPVIKILFSYLQRKDSNIIHYDS